MMDDRQLGFEARSVSGSDFSNLLSVSREPEAYPFDAQESTTSCSSLPKKYWLSAKNLNIGIAIIDVHSFTRECITRSLRECDGALNVSSFDTCDNFLKESREYDLIVYHVHGASPRKHNDDRREYIVPFEAITKIAPVIVLSDIDNPASILDAFESGARGYIPTADTTLKLMLEIIRLVRAGGTFVPASSLALRRSAGRNEPSEPGSIATQQFTPRQLAVLRHLKLGKANKAIARELEMSESTVKIHLRNIMKKMRASNRTEVACRAHAFDTMHMANVTCDSA